MLLRGLVLFLSLSFSVSNPFFFFCYFLMSQLFFFFFTKNREVEEVRDIGLLKDSTLTLSVFFLLYFFVSWFLCLLFSYHGKQKRSFCLIVGLLVDSTFVMISFSCPPLDSFSNSFYVFCLLYNLYFMGSRKMEIV